MASIGFDEWGKIYYENYGERQWLCDHCENLKHPQYTSRIYSVKIDQYDIVLTTNKFKEIRIAPHQLSNRGIWLCSLWRYGAVARDRAPKINCVTYKPGTSILDECGNGYEIDEKLSDWYAVCYNKVFAVNSITGKKLSDALIPSFSVPYINLSRLYYIDQWEVNALGLLKVIVNGVTIVAEMFLDENFDRISKSVIKSQFRSFWVDTNLQCGNINSDPKIIKTRFGQINEEPDKPGVYIICNTFVYKRTNNNIEIGRLVSVNGKKTKPALPQPDSM